MLLEVDNMIYQLDGVNYNVEIVRKNNKNTYVRVRDDLTIYVTTGVCVTKGEIKKLLDENSSFLRKGISKAKKHIEKSEKFMLFGISYDVVFSSEFKSVSIDKENRIIYVFDDKKLNSWLKKQMRILYLKRIDLYYNMFEESIPYPSLKIRRMTTRWGVCNRKLKTITLNSRLIEFSIDKLDYVVVHELSHFVHFDHSKNFWNVVSKYCKDYKKIRKELNE